MRMHYLGSKSLAPILKTDSDTLMGRTIKEVETAGTKSFLIAECTASVPLDKLRMMASRGDFN